VPKPLQLQMLTDSNKIHEAFSNWSDALMEHGDSRDSLRWLPQRKIFFRANRNEATPDQSVVLGLDPAGKNATVELNEPLQYGTENSLSGVARDRTGRLYLLRQGTLQKNAQSARIDEPLFVERTDLNPADVTINGARAKRSWFIVTALDVPSLDICRNTAAFVDRCNLARDADAEVTAKHDDERLAELFGKPEQGGQIAGQPTINLNQRRRIQGEVWQKLRPSWSPMGVVSLNRGPPALRLMAKSKPKPRSCYLRLRPIAQQQTSTLA
jgi:hypothetical protein